MACLSLSNPAPSLPRSDHRSQQQISPLRNPLEMEIYGDGYRDLGSKRLSGHRSFKNPWKMRRHNIGEEMSLEASNKADTIYFAVFIRI
mmetsp:Transcript_14027/g.28595  ORF Transcript_14027/g.28595 Transcript_14027/m.28595 type:complete len:89 (-) Transcript_14027:793-1059(-)